MSMCSVCAEHGINAVASERHQDVDAAAIIASGFEWTVREALDAGWSHTETMCEECYAQLPRVPSPHRRPAIHTHE